MKSQYAILTLKHVGLVSVPDDYVNKDLCVDCYDKISKLMDDDKAMIVSTKGSWITVKDSGVIDSSPKDVSPLERGTYVTWTGNDPLNKHLDVTCV